MASLSEPLLGAPHYIDYDGRRVSQDLGRSVVEYETIRSRLPGLGSAPLIGEVGPGYGRLAYVFAQATSCRYVFFDIPPALAVAQWYFTALFGADQVAPFQRDFDLVAATSRRFAFCTPNQIERFPEGCFDLGINADSFGEMQRASAVHLLAQMRRTSQTLYLRNLRPSMLSTDGAARWPVPAEADYAAPAGWHEPFKRTWPIDYRYFEAVQVKA